MAGIWVRHFAFQSYTHGFTETRYWHCSYGIGIMLCSVEDRRCRFSEENVDGLLFLHGLKIGKQLSYFSYIFSWH